MTKTKQEQKKERAKRIRSSVIYWLVIFMLYAAFFGTLGLAITKWALWLRIVVVVVVILVPIAGQVMLILNHKKRSGDK